MIQLNTADIEWFEKVYGGSTLSWALSMLLEEFRKAHEHTPQDYAKLAARHLEEQVNDSS